MKWYTRKIEKGTGVAEDQANDLERRPLGVRVRRRRRVRLPRASLVRGVPADEADDVDNHKAKEVLLPGLRRVEDVVANDGRLGLGRVAGATAAAGRLAATGEQRRVLVGRVGGVGVGAGGGAGGLAPVEAVVVEALDDEDAVGDAKVAGEGDGGRGEVGEEGACFAWGSWLANSGLFGQLRRREKEIKLTEKIGDVAEHPDDQKGHAEAVGALGLVVGNHLRQLSR